MQSRIKYLSQNYHTVRLIENLQNINYETMKLFQFILFVLTMDLWLKILLKL